MALFEEIGRRIANAGQGVAQQTKNLTETTRLNAKISENKKKMSQLLFEMGNDYYKKHRKDVDCEEQEYINKVNALFFEVIQLEDEIEKIKTSENCKACGARLSNGAAFCMSCGAKLGKDDIEEMEAPQKASKACPACGEIVDADSLFCVSCGAKLSGDENGYSDEQEYEQDAAARICPVCGAEAEDDDVFCIGCGNKL